MPHDPERAPLLLLGCGLRIYREYMLEALAAQGPLWLMVEAPVPSWAARHAERTVPAAVRDPRDCLRAVAGLPGGAVAGVLTYDEMAVESVAHVAVALGLPSNTVEVARRCRDKHLMRERWRACGVPSARSVVATDVGQALGHAEALGYPVVVKPRNLAGSVGVVRCATPDEVRDACGHAAAGGSRFGAATDLLVEEYLDGPEVSVESVVASGDCRPIAITRKRLGEPPGFEETGHAVSAADPEPHDAEVLEVVRAAHRALGVELGVTHAEVRVTPMGPRMIELGARPAGDLIPLLVRLATGVDLTSAAGRLARGLAPDVRPDRVAAAAVRFFYPAMDARVRRLRLAPGFHPPWLECLEWKARPGDELLLPPRGYLGRLGFAVVVGRDRRACEQRLDEVEANLDIDLEPLTEQVT